MTTGKPSDSALGAEQTALVPSVLEREQRARTVALRRFNWLYLYIPVVVVAGIMLGLLLTLAWATLFGGGEFQREYSSGIADIYIMLTCLLPLTLICAIFPLGGVFLLYTRRKRGSFVSERLQRLLRRVDSLLVTAADKADQIEPKVAQPIIRSRGWLAYFGTLLRTLQTMILELLGRK
jgi:MFS superfamily sulfate permease-like transporter